MKVFFQPEYPTTVKVNINGADVTSIRQRVKNILDVYEQRNATEESAANWYVDAHEQAKAMADTSGLCLWQTSGLIALISPKMKWHVNIKMAWFGLESWMNGEQPRLSPFNTKFTKSAYDLLDGKEVNAGQKVGTFWQTIYNPDNESVTIDSVATSIVLGRTVLFPGTYSLGYGTMERPSKPYREIQKSYVSAAKKVNISPVALQAITWTTARRLKRERPELTGKVLANEFNDFSNGSNVVASDFMKHLTRKYRK